MQPGLSKQDNVMRQEGFLDVLFKQLVTRDTIRIPEHDF
jgi:hypothetical protein